MPSPGRTPKPPGQRRRRNLDQPQWRKLPAEGVQREAPEPRTERTLGRIATRYWETLWASPMAAAYTDADIQPLTRLVVLVDERSRYEQGDLERFDGDAEIRNLEDRFGISPLARRRLQWEIDQATKAAPPETAEVRRLRAV